MDNNYAKNKARSGKGSMTSGLKYRVTVNDEKDSGVVMDTKRPFNKQSPYMDISANFDSVNKKGGLG
jgi:hypothetical protein